MHSKYSLNVAVYCQTKTKIQSIGQPLRKTRLKMQDLSHRYITGLTRIITGGGLKVNSAESNNCTDWLTKWSFDHGYRLEIWDSPSKDLPLLITITNLLLLL